LRLDAAGAAQASRAAGARVFGGDAAAHVLAPAQDADHEDGDEGGSGHAKQTSQERAVLAKGVQEKVDRVHGPPLRS
jgi:hypothetical protein